MKKLLEIKKKIKSKLPEFSRKDSHKKPKLGTKWRRPKGLHNKLRLQLRGHKVMVKPGYRTPSALRHSNKEGMNLIKISNMNDLEKVNPKEAAVVISAGVSKKTRLSLIEFAISKNIKIENVKDAKAEVEKIKADYKSRIETSHKVVSSRKAKKEKLESATKKKTEKSEKSDKADKVEKAEKSEVTEDEQASKAKKEKDKVLTKRS